MTEIDIRVQTPAPGVEVEMFDIDLRPKGGIIRRFTNWVREDNTKIVWRGNTYDPVAMEATGYGVNGEGKPIRPRIKIGNGYGGTGSDYVPGDLSALCAMHDDFIGCPVVRWKTYREFLDDGALADPATMFPKETYVVSQKLEESFMYIEWELTTTFDQEGETLPKGIMSRKFCRYTYRVYDAGEAEFDYTRVQCPYELEGSGKYFTETDQPTANPALDKCSHRRSGCQKRFGTKAPLPIRAFPGMTPLTRRG